MCFDARPATAARRGRRHGVPRHPHAVAHIVSGNVVHHQPKGWHERYWAAARTRLGPRRTGLDVAAQAAQSLGTTGPGSTYGEIDVDATYVGGPEEGKRGRTSEKKSLVVVATEKHGRAISRIRLKRVKDVSAERLMDFTRETVEPGTTMHTAGKKGSAGLSAVGYTHRITVIRCGDEQPYEVMPPVHHTASLLKRWRLGTLQGGVQPQHLDYDLDKYMVRFNRRRSHTRGLLVYRRDQQAAAAAPSPKP